MRNRAFNIYFGCFYINLLIMKPFFFIKEKETNEQVVDTDFTVSFVTVIFGRYDNESPPCLLYTSPSPRD